MIDDQITKYKQNIELLDSDFYIEKEKENINNALHRRASYLRIIENLNLKTLINLRKFLLFVRHQPFKDILERELKQSKNENRIPNLSIFL